MALKAVSPAFLINLITEIIEIPVNNGQFKNDCSNLARRVALLKPLLEEISDSSSSSPTESKASTSREFDWWSDLVVGLQAAKCLMYSATSFQALKSSDLAKERKITFNFQSVNWTLEKALDNVPFDRYSISLEVREQVELASSQLRRAKWRYGSLNSVLFAKVLSQPIEKYVFTNTRRKVTDKFETVLEAVQSNISLAEEKKSESSPSLAFFLSKDAEEERVAVSKNMDDSKKSDKVTIPEDFLCPISLEMMNDPVIVSTGQTYERSYIERWMECGNERCPKTQQKHDFSLTQNYVLKSLISQWCTKHNIEQSSGDYMNGMTRNRNISTDISAIQALVERVLSISTLEVDKAALTEIICLSQTSTDNRIRIAQAGAIPILILLSIRGQDEIKEYAVTCVLNLSIHERIKEWMMNAGVVRSLVHLLRQGTMKAKENAAATLFSLSLADDNKIKIGESGAIPYLVNLLENGSIRGKKDAATALASLCGYQGNIVIAVKAGIVNPLVKILTDSSQGVVDEALTLLSVLAGNQEARAEIFKANVIPPLVDCLHKEPRSGEKVAAILLFLCKRDTEKLIFIGKLGAVVPLMKLSRDGTKRAKRKAKSLLELLRQAA